MSGSMVRAAAFVVLFPFACRMGTRWAFQQLSTAERQRARCRWFRAWLDEGELPRTAACVFVLWVTWKGFSDVLSFWPDNEWRGIATGVLALFTTAVIATLATALRDANTRCKDLDAMWRYQHHRAEELLKQSWATPGQTLAPPDRAA